MLTCLVGILSALNDSPHAWHLAQCLAHRNNSINVNFFKKGERVRMSSVWKCFMGAFHMASHSCSCESGELNYLPAKSENCQRKMDSHRKPINGKRTPHQGIINHQKHLKDPESAPAPKPRICAQKQTQQWKQPSIKFTPWLSALHHPHITPGTASGTEPLPGTSKNTQAESPVAKQKLS